MNSYEDVGFNDLPNEVIIPILENLPTKDFINTCSTNTRIRDLCYDRFLLRNRLPKDFPKYPAPEGISNEDWYVTILDNLRKLVVLPEAKLINILAKVPLVDLFGLASASSKINDLLNIDRFWQHRIGHDFPTVLFPENLKFTTYRDYYMKLLNDLASLDNMIFTEKDGRKTYDYTIDDIMGMIEKGEMVKFLKPGNIRYMWINTVSIYTGMNEKIIGYRQLLVLDKEVRQRYNIDEHNILTYKSAHLEESEIRDIVKFILASGYILYRPHIIDSYTYTSTGIIAEEPEDTLRRNEYVSTESIMRSILEGAVVASH